MQLREKPARLLLEDILVVTELPPWVDDAVSYALGLAREHRAKMHVAHAISAHLRNSVKNVPSDGSFQNYRRDVLQALDYQRASLGTLVTTSNVSWILELKGFDLVITSAGHCDRSEPICELSRELRSSDCPLLILGPSVSRIEPLRSG